MNSVEFLFVCLFVSIANQFFLTDDNDDGDDDDEVSSDSDELSFPTASGYLKASDSSVEEDDEGDSFEGYEIYKLTLHISALFFI